MLSSRPLPALNLIVFLASIQIFSFVAGLMPSLAALSFTLRSQIREAERRRPLEGASPTASTKRSTPFQHQSSHSCLFCHNGDKLFLVHIKFLQLGKSLFYFTSTI